MKVYLTKKQFEVYECYGKGNLTIKQTAEKLKINVSGVYRHLQLINRKFGYRWSRKHNKTTRYIEVESAEEED